MSLKDPNPVRKVSPKRVAIVLSNPAVSTTTGWPVGFWWSELTHPYYAFTEKGYQIDICSPVGGKCEGDAMSDPRDSSGYSSSDLISMGFVSTPALAALVDDTKPVKDVKVADYDANPAPVPSMFEPSGATVLSIDGSRIAALAQFLL